MGLLKTIRDRWLNISKIPANNSETLKFLLRQNQESIKKLDKKIDELNKAVRKSSVEKSELEDKKSKLMAVSETLNTAIKSI